MPDVDAGRVVAYGRSLGRAAACVLASQRSLAALVLESTFTSTADLMPRLNLNTTPRTVLMLPMPVE